MNIETKLILVKYVVYTDTRIGSNWNVQYEQWVSDINGNTHNNIVHIILFTQNTKNYEGLSGKELLITT